MKTKTVHCSWCGETMETATWDRGPYSCGEQECEQGLRESVQAQEDEARERAEEDGFYQYGGPGTY